MDFQTIFKRYEIKFILSKSQEKELLELMEEHMILDQFGKSLICNLYYDTDSFLLIRRSLDKPIYKEKIRVRSYGVASGEDNTFIELKKKFEDVVYKRRIVKKADEAIGFLGENGKDSTNQIEKEIAYCFKIYPNLRPRVYISYERRAFYGIDDPLFRMTLDENLLFREDQLSLKIPPSGEKLLEDNQVLLEVKTKESLPLWLVDFLSKNQIYKTSFSKYGKAYMLISSKQKEDVVHV
jgi:SPX domain protein involved in polyphosphate accumulation